MADARIDRHSAVVEQDLPDIYSFIAERDPAAAERVLDAVEETFRQLAQGSGERAWEASEIQSATLIRIKLARLPRRAFQRAICNVIT